MDSARTAMLFCPPLPPQRVDPGVPVAIGRHPSCEFAIRKSDVSRRHAEIRQVDGAFVLRDLGSTNGTFVNGEPVDGECPLSPGDRIEIGSTTLTFCTLDGAIDDELLVPGEAQTMIFERATRPDAFHGQLGEIPPFAVLQVLELGGKTGMLEIEGESGTGSVWFDRGRPVHAVTEKHAGFDAAVAIVNTERGSFRFEAQSVAVEPTIRATVTELLLEASRQRDEGLVGGL